jgi:hypothetical protein
MASDVIPRESRGMVEAHVVLHVNTSYDKFELRPAGSREIKATYSLVKFTFPMPPATEFSRHILL